MSVKNIPSELCVRCRGGRYLCGLTYCPLLVRYTVRFLSRRLKRVDREIVGSSPPSVFIGRIGYPYVNVGPATPPFTGETSIFDLPEYWLKLSLNDVLEYRYLLIRGKQPVKVTNVNSGLPLKLQELTLTLKPVDVEVYLVKPPKPKIVFNEYTPPLGPSGDMRDFKITSNPKSDRRLEKVYYDTDLKAQNGVVYLYKSGVPVTAIQKILSVGGLGVEKYRRLVPTRWSITAVDSIISQHLVDEVKKLPLINEYQVYIRNIMKNLFIVILAPRPWSFEWMEAWFPGSTWNPQGLNVEIEGDYEGFKGRTSYPEIGGCYYAARLAVSEALVRMKRQATAILWREIYEGFNIPVGVWFVRECLRETLKSKPVKFNSLTEALQYIGKYTRVNIKTWTQKSHLVKQLLHQELLDKHLRLSTHG